MSASSSILGFLGILIVIAAFITFIVVLILGISGFQTKQYGSFKKSLKVFGFICAAFVILLIAYAVSVYTKQNATKDIVNAELGYQLSLPAKYANLLSEESVEMLSPEQKTFEDDPPQIETEYSMDARGTAWEQDTVNVFSIVAYPRAWWNEHVEERDTGKLFPTPFIDGEEANVLGVFVGKNNSYAITFMPSIDGFYGCTEDQKELKQTKQCTAIDYARYNGPTNIVVFDP